MFKPLVRKKAPLDIFEQIRSDILNQKFKLGDPLPQEKEMTEQFGVSRQTLREALRALEAIGMLEIKKGFGGGPVVSDMDRDDLRKLLVNFFVFKDISIKELCLVRKLIEPYLASEASKTMSPEQVSELENLNLQCRKMLDQGKTIIGNPKEIQFHMNIAKASGNLILEAILDFVIFFMENFKKLYNADLNFSASILKSHEMITDAIKNKNNLSAANLMSKHISDVENFMILSHETKRFDN